MTMSEAEKRQKRKDRRNARKAALKVTRGPGTFTDHLADVAMLGIQRNRERQDYVKNLGTVEGRPVHASKSGGKHPALIPVMLASDDHADRALHDPTYLIQEKYDGSRVCAIKSDGNLWMMGRSWKNDFAPGYPEIVSELKRLPADNFVIDGELTFFKKGGYVQFVTALATPSTKAGFDVKLMLFDIQEWNGRNYRGVPLNQRLQLLNRVIPKNMRHLQVVETHTDHTRYPEIFNRIVARGGEGVVAKKKNSPYIGDSRAYWVKVKRAATEDVVVLGITTGTGKRLPTFGALILGQYDKNGQMKAIGKSSGFDDAMLEKLYRIVMAMPEVKSYPGVDIKDVKRWVSPKMVIEVEYMEKTPYGILRHPRFVRVRDDKLPSQCKIQ